MKTSSPKRCLSSAAFTLIESFLAVAVVGISLVALYLGISSGFQMVQVSRENLRATQIVIERLETIRLYTLDQLTNSTFMPAKFTNWYSFQKQGGFPYVGTISVSNWSPSENPNYVNDLRLVTVELKWTSAGESRTRSMQTLVARDGLQEYVY